MHPSVLLMGCLLTLYVVTMVMFWHSRAGQPPAARVETAGRLALQTGQTIVGVVRPPKAWHLRSASMCGMRSMRRDNRS